MKAKDFIDKLQALVQEHGDHVDVCVTLNSDETGFYVLEITDLVFDGDDIDIETEIL